MISSYTYIYADLICMTLLGFINLRLYYSINLKYLSTLDSRLKALTSCRNFLSHSRLLLDMSCFNNLLKIYVDLYTLTRYVDAKDQKDGPNNMESDLGIAQLQPQRPANEPNEPGALMYIDFLAFSI